MQSQHVLLAGAVEGASDYVRYVLRAFSVVVTVISVVIISVVVNVINIRIGVGIFHLYEPLALSAGGMAGGAVFSVVMTFVYRWGIRGLI
ncbi:MAG: hypothetical protein IIB85_03680 [Chloroflexi bacterium]|nr:hypothetical protein [Chloroflexota bacterium]